MVDVRWKEGFGVKRYVFKIKVFPKDSLGFNIYLFGWWNKLIDPRPPHVSTKISVLVLVMASSNLCNKTLIPKHNLTLTIGNNSQTLCVKELYYNICCHYDVT